MHVAHIIDAFDQSITNQRVVFHLESRSQSTPTKPGRSYRSSPERLFGLRRYGFLIVFRPAQYHKCSIGPFAIDFQWQRIA